MDLVIHTNYKKEPINIIIEDFKNDNENISFDIETVIIFKKGKWIERTLDNFNDSKFIDKITSKLIKLHDKRGWLNVSEII